MNKEELSIQTMKDCILYNWRGKVSYPLNYKDLEELEKIIDYYEDIKNNLQQQLSKREKITNDAVKEIKNNISELNRQIDILEDKEDRMSALVLVAVKNSFYKVEEILERKI